MIYKAEDYSYTVDWSDEYEAYVAIVLEFKSLAAHGDTREEALREIKYVVALVLDDLRKDYQLIPEPIKKG